MAKGAKLFGVPLVSIHAPRAGGDGQIPAYQ